MTFTFPALNRFLDRSADLARLEDWWSGSEGNALAVYGRRRVGKSWLVRRFAHGKRALVLVAERRAEAPQLARFADQLAPWLGVRPSLDGVAALIDALYSLGGDERTLVVVDEFPYLLPSRERQRSEVLTSIQRVMEERDASRLKLLLCGSYIGQMERLLRGPLRGRVTPLQVDPLSFAEAQPFLDASRPPAERIERFAVAGGTSMYLDELARGGSLRQRVCARVLDPRGPLFNDAREVLEEELRSPGIYYSLLEELSSGAKSLGDLGTRVGRRTTDLQGYLDTLRGMRVVRRSAPVTARDVERSHRYRLDDDFMRFWFRFVFPFQEELRTGLAPRRLYEAEIAGSLADHVSPTFESLCREWVLRDAEATRVGEWWGGARHDLRRAGSRHSEQIDVVGLRRAAVSVVGECKWTAAPMDLEVLRALEIFKIPALRQGKVGLARPAPRIVLFSKSGFARGLQEAARGRPDLRLVGVEELVADLVARP